jgi:dTDP-4-amino-4,6-dideoxygalactose transaminase
LPATAWPAPERAQLPDAQRGPRRHLSHYYNHNHYRYLPMNVPLLDLKPQYHALKAELDAALLRVAESQYFILGPEVKELEKNIAAYVGTKHAIGVSSGTDALLLSMMALGIGAGHAVIVPTFSFFATAGAVARLGAVPVLVDVDPVTFNIDPAAVRKAISECAEQGVKVRAICPVHLFGQSADMDAIMEIAREYKLDVVEDCAQAIGVQYKDGRRVGSIGTVGCFSFFPSKNLGCFGDGGIITVNDDALAHRIEIMRVHGGEPKYYHKILGGNFRIDAIQAAVLNVKLPHLDSWHDGRRRNAETYNKLFVNAGLAQETGKTQFDDYNKVLLPASVFEKEGFKHPYLHIFNQYCIRVQQRDALIEHLRACSIGCEIYYPVPFHKQECFGSLPSSTNAFPVSDEAAASVIALPIYPELTVEMLEYVVGCVVQFFNH